ncbi:MAG: AarF/UbiB family protein [Verrucomicrobia bacterium]|nr:AarF/UbiB family protein [Verrucomicrobiota bacterium]
MALDPLHLFRDAVRAKEIVGILLKYRFDELLEKLDTPAAWLTRIVPSVKGNFTLWQRLRMAVEELGPTFVKVAQILSTRPDVLPRELIEEFEQLQEQVKPVEFTLIRVALEKELGGPLEDEFVEFDTTPVASGSIGQIHRARLRSDGREVAIKIQRPDIRKPIMTDLDILGWFAAQIHANITALKAFDLPTVVDELRQAMTHELDFSREARNASLFNSLNQDPEHVFAPEVIEAYTTSRLLVTEWINGTSVRRAQLEPANAARLAKIGGNSFFAQIVMTGFFHADPHPGNIMVADDGRLCFVDWGLSGQLTKQMRHHITDLFSACAERDPEKVATIAMNMSRSTKRIDRIELEKRITSVLFKYQDSLTKMEDMGRLILEMVFVFGSCGINVARDYTLLAKAVISIEKSARRLDPEFDLITVGKPYIRELNWQRWNPVSVLRNTFSTAHTSLKQISELPNDLRRLLHRIEDEDLRVNIEHRGLGKMGDGLDAAFSRLALSVIVGCVFVGSSFVINTGTPPFLWGYPAIGILGYLLSSVLGLYVAFDILRHGRHK